MGLRLGPRRSQGITEGTSVWEVALKATSREGIERNKRDRFKVLTISSVSSFPINLQ